MSDELLPYYNRELAYIRTSGGEFAEKYPKIAGRLRLTHTGSQDPHVERVLEGFAYLCARIRHKLDDDFPEITDAMLGVLYPHYQAPTPSMAVVQFNVDRTQAELTSGYEVPRGTPLDTEPVDGEPLPLSRRATTPTLWPILGGNCRTARPTVRAPATRSLAQAPAVVHLRLATFSDAVKFGQFRCESLRFFLHAGEAHNIYQLYELLVATTRCEIALACSPRDPKPFVLPKTALVPSDSPATRRSCRFRSDRSSVIDCSRSFSPSRKSFSLSTCTGIDPRYLAHVGNRSTCSFTSTARRRSWSGRFRATRSGWDALRPSICLRCEPILSCSAIRARSIGSFPTAPADAAEIYSIDKVFATSPGGEQASFTPFYSFKHAVDRVEQNTFWYASRRPKLCRGRRAWTRKRPARRCTCRSSISNFSPSVPDNWTVELEVTCVNRDLPRRLPFGGGRPELDLTGGKGPISRGLRHPPHTDAPAAA